jgi:hypothetical protein
MADSNKKPGDPSEIIELLEKHKGDLRDLFEFDPQKSTWRLKKRPYLFSDAALQQRRSAARQKKRNSIPKDVLQDELFLIAFDMKVKINTLCRRLRCLYKRENRIEPALAEINGEEEDSTDER